MGLLLSTRRTMVSAGQTYSDKVMGYGPIAYWPLNEVSGTTAACLVNAAQNGTYSSDVSAMGIGTGIGDGNTAVYFDGANDYVNILTATMTAAFGKLTGTFMIWGKVNAVGIWTDGAQHYLAQLRADANDYFVMAKAVANNRLIHTYRAGGVSEILLEDAVSTTAWSCHVVTWDKTGTGNAISYRDSTPINTLAIANNWTANLTLAVIGAQNVVPNNAWHGWLAHCALWDRPLSVAEITALAAV